MDITALVGCASHPSAQAALRAEGAMQEREQCIVLAKQQMDSERSEFLDIIYSFCNNDCPADENQCGSCKILRVSELMESHKKDSLRQSQSTGGKQEPQQAQQEERR